MADENDAIDADWIDSRLAQIHNGARSVVEENVAHCNKILDEIDEKLSQEIKVAREKLADEMTEILEVLKEKLSSSYISSLADASEETLNVAEFVNLLAARVEKNSWLNVVREAQFSLADKLPRIKVNQNVVEDAAIWRKNLLVAKKENTEIDEFLVEVCSIVDTDEFYIHRLRDSKKIEALEILLTYSPSFEQPEEVEVGKIYAVYVSVHKTWFRGQCGKKCGNYHVGNGPSQSLFECFLLDEGIYERIPSLQFRILPDEVLKIKPLAYCCSLHKYLPTPWRPNAVQYFKQLAKRSPLSMNVFANKGGYLTVDLAHLAQFAGDAAVVSFRDAMFFLQDEGKLSQVPEQLAKINSKVDVAERGMCYKGVVSELQSPLRFYVDFEGLCNREQYTNLMRDLQTECNAVDADVKLAVENPVVGQYYAVRWGKENLWYRVLIESKQPHDRVSLFFIDSGHRLTPYASGLRKLPNKYLLAPAQVTCCKLDGIAKPDGARLFSRQACEFLRKMMIGQHVTVFVNGSHDGDVGSARRHEKMLFVVLYVNDETVSVNTKFARARHGRSLRQHELASHNRGQDVNDATTKAPTLTVDLNASCVSSVSTGSTWLDSLVAASQEIDMPVPIPAPTKSSKPSLDPVAPPFVPESGTSWLDSLVTSSREVDFGPVAAIQNGDAVVVEEDLDEETDPLIVDYRRMTPLTRSTAEACLNKLSDLEFHLSFIKSRSWISGDRPRDKFVAKNGTMPSPNDFAIDVKFVACESPGAVLVRPVAYQKLYDMMPDLLQRAYGDCDLKRPKFDCGFPCAVHVASIDRWIRASVADISGNICTVRGWDDGREHDVAIGSVLPLVEPFDAIPKLLLCCSLAEIYPPLGMDWEPPVTSRISSLLDAAEEVVVFTDVCPDLKASFMAVQLVFKYDSEGGPLESPGKSLVNLNKRLVKEGLASLFSTTGVAIKAWPTSPSPPVPDTFDAHVTWLNLEGDIYFYNVHSSDKLLKDMQRALDASYENSIQTAADLQLRVGDLCIARYMVDGSWYRATIIAVGERPNTVSVLFADYGTTDYVAETDVRKVTAFDSVAVQAIKASIFNAKPIGFDDGKSWSLDTLDTIHALIVDTDCVVRVVKRSPLQVSVRMANGVDLAEHLFMEHLADFVETPPSFL